jgi:hypothetical protein
MVNSRMISSSDRGLFGRGMVQHRRRRNARRLAALLLLAAAYGSLLSALGTLTGTDTADGSIGVILGLYICSHPAANAIDVLFLERGGLRRVSSEWAGIGWLALNLAVVFAGWLVIVIGTTRLVSRF